MISEKEFITLLNPDTDMVLSREEEHAVFEYYFKNPTLENRNRIVEKNQGLVRSIVPRYKGYADEEDLFQEGVLGLIRAVEEFDHERGTKFSTIAFWWIRQSMSRYVANNMTTIRIPVHLRDTFYKIKKYIDAAVVATGNLPDPEKMAEDLELSDEAIDKYFIWQNNITSLDKLASKEESTNTGDTIKDFVSDETVDVENDVIKKIMTENIVDFMKNNLGAREYKIMALRYGLEGDSPYTLREIGEEYGLSRERIRQIEASALRKLRFRLRRAGYKQEDLL